MKNLKPLIAAGMVSFTLLAAAPASAKPHGDRPHSSEHREHHQQKRFRKMLDKIGATEAQKTEIQQIHSDRKAGMKDLREQMKALKEEQKALDPRADNYDQQLGSIAVRKGQLVEAKMLWKGETRKQVALVLTESQVAELKQFREERKEKRKERRR